MEVSPYLLVNKLVIQGITNSYEAKFKEGLNLIWGDMDSGKSSILNLIDYCLGGKNNNLLYGEMTAKGRIAFLEINLNGSIFTFARDILYEAAAIRVFSGAYSEHFGRFPMLMASAPNQEMPDGWVSDFILENLGIAKVRIKESRLREDASSDRLSFRDLMKLLYLKQTQVGSDSLLNFSNPAVFNKNVEIQKFVYNIYDDRLSCLQSELSEESSRLKDLEKNEVFVRKFLQGVNINTDKLDVVGNEKEVCESRLEELESGIQALKKDFILSTDLGLTISKAVANLKSQLTENENELSKIEKKYQNFVKLNNTYQLDLGCLNVSKIARKVIHTDFDESNKLLCPLCSSEISLMSPVIDDRDVDDQIKSIKNRSAGIQSVLAQLREKQKCAQALNSDLSNEIQSKSRSFDENNIQVISPLIIAIETIENSKTIIKLEIAEHERNHSIAQKYVDILQHIEAKSSLVDKLRRTIKRIQDELVGLDDVINDLSKLLNNHLINSGLQKATAISVDKRFIPHFRNISYYNTSSGGVRTITSIASFLIRLKYLLIKPSNLPTFLMIDTPGQNIGRYRSSEDESELSDPKLYENIFKQIVEVTATAKSNGRKCQIIVVDNDFPPLLREGENFHLVKRFSKKGGGFDKGLINDI